MDRREFFFKKINIALALFVCVILAFSVPLSAFAVDGFQFEMKSARPSVSPTQGYIEFLMCDEEDGHYFPYVYFWNTTAYSSSGGTNINMFVEIHDDRNFEIYPYGATPSDTKAMYTMTSVGRGGQYWSKGFSSTEPFKLNFAGSHIIVDARVFGNGYINSTGYDYKQYSGDWELLYSDNADKLLVQKLLEEVQGIHDEVSLDRVENLLQQIDNNTDGIESYLTVVQDLLESSLRQLGTIDDTLNTKLQSIYARLNYIERELKTANSWLERIFESIRELFDKDEDTPQDDVSESDEKIDSASKEEEDVLEDIDDKETTNEERKEQIEQMKVDGTVEQSGTWSVFNGVLGANPKIMSMLVTVLSIAVVGLIFNR